MISNEDISAITQNILTTMLELEATLDGQSESPGRADMLAGCVQISGEWQGAVVLQSSRTFARLVASRLFQIDPSSVNEADVRDAFAELTNMIGGNIKGLVPSPSFLSIPSVTTGQDFDFHLAGASVIRDVNIECDGEPLKILMCEEDPTQSGRLAARRHDSIAL